MSSFLYFYRLFYALSPNLQQGTAFIRDSLDGYIQKGLNDWNLPGLAVVIVKDGKIVWMKGYGVRDIETKKPVDENTLFMIASNTKLFTAVPWPCWKHKIKFHWMIPSQNIFLSIDYTIQLQPVW